MSSIGMDLRSRTIEIPIRNSEEVIELECTSLPEAEEVLQILIQEKAQMKIWVRLALEYWRQERKLEFAQILESARQDAGQDYHGHEKDTMRCLDTLAAYNVICGKQETDKERQTKYFMEATQLYTLADKVIMYDQNHLLGRACFCLLDKGDQLDQADNQFNFVLDQDPNSIPALLGKACIAFNKRDYKGALGHYKKCLRLNPGCPADVRLGMGLCFYKMNKTIKAVDAFSRALELNHKCVGALIGLAVINLNNKDTVSIRDGIKLLGNAYKYDNNQPLVLVHLANHFFFKKDLNKVQHLALHALQNTEHQQIRAEACYQLGRCFHVQNDQYERAFQYYNQATQFSSPKYALPFYYLGLMYLRRSEPSDVEQAILCFEKIIKEYPNEHDTMRILGHLYAESPDREKVKLAKEYLEKVTETNPADWEAMIDYAQVLEQFTPEKALVQYGKVMALLKENELDIRPEIYNNIGSLHIRMGNLHEAKTFLNQAMEKVKLEGDMGGDQSYTKNIRNTIRYNIARLSEEMYAFDRAILLYKEILTDNSKYIDAYLRLGCMHRDKGQIFDASDWFKEALQIDPESPDAWTLIGNLHLHKEEWGPGQKKFERILKSERTANDAYANVALGNVWLQTIHQPTRDTERLKRHQDRALTNYKNVLRTDDKNIYAANGIGAVLAHRGYIREARDIFSQVREATSEMKDVWFNLAHVCVEQKQHTSAIQMYKNAMTTFNLTTDPECLTYLARALFKANRMEECKKCLIKARRVAPDDTVVLYNLALVMQQLAQKKLIDTKSNLKAVVGAVRDLELSQKYFSWLQDNGDRMKFDPNGAQKEASNCKDTLAQAPFYVKRAKQIDDEERTFKEKTQASMSQFQLRRQQKEEDKKAALISAEKALESKRQEYVSKTKEVLDKVNIPSEKFGKGGEKKAKRKRKEKREDDLINDNESDAEAGSAVKKRKKKAEKKRRQQDTNETAPMMESSEDEAKPSKYNPKHKSKEFIQDDSSSDEDFKATKDEPKKLNSSSDESGDEKPAVNRNAMLASSSDEDDAPAARKNALESSDDEGPTEKKLESSDDEAPTKKKAKLDSDSDDAKSGDDAKNGSDSD